MISLPDIRSGILEAQERYGRRPNQLWACSPLDLLRECPVLGVLGRGRLCQVDGLRLKYSTEFQPWAILLRFRIPRAVRRARWKAYMASASEEELEWRADQMAAEDIRAVNEEGLWRDGRWRWSPVPTWGGPDG